MKGDAQKISCKTKTKDMFIFIWIYGHIDMDKWIYGIPFEEFPRFCSFMKMLQLFIIIHIQIHSFKDVTFTYLLTHTELIRARLSCNESVF